MAVRLAAWRRDSAERDLAEAVRAAREQRPSWREVGEAIGTSGEAGRRPVLIISSDDAITAIPTFVLEQLQP